MTERISIAAVAALLGILSIVAPMVVSADAAGSADAVLGVDLVGDWEGTLAVGETRLRLVFHLKRSDDGTLDATIDSPDQGASGIPVERVTIEGDSITFDVSAIGAGYAGELTADRQAIEGKWSQSGWTFPLRVDRIGG